MTQQTSENRKIEEGKIILDNQALEVTVFMPSGCLQILDKVSGLWWEMPDDKTCGTLSLTREGQEKTYWLGGSGSLGVAFKANYYMKRNTEEDDFHEVSLNGSLGDQPNTQVTLRYLLSNSYPALHCFAYLEGPEKENATTFKFPSGFRISDAESHKVFWPKDLKTFQTENPETAYDALWLPPKDEEHKVAGSPLFVLTQNLAEQGASCIGFLSHPLCTIEITRHEKSRCVTPVSEQLEQTGRTLEFPYHVQYRFLPTTNHEALVWTCLDVLNRPAPQFHL